MTVATKLDCNSAKEIFNINRYDLYETVYKAKSYGLKQPTDFYKPVSTKTAKKLFCETFGIDKATSRNVYGVMRGKGSIDVLFRVAVNKINSELYTSFDLKTSEGWSVVSAACNYVLYRLALNPDRSNSQPKLSSTFAFRYIGMQLKAFWAYGASDLVFDELYARNSRFGSSCLIDPEYRFYRRCCNLVQRLEMSIELRSKYEQVFWSYSDFTSSDKIDRTFKAVFAEYIDTFKI